MNRLSLAATAVALALTAASTAAAAAELPDPPDQANPEATDARAAAPATAMQPDRGQPERSVVAPPKPQVETIVQPGETKIHKHERVSDVLKARERAGGTGRVVAE
ncbi:hypothetical protein J7E62_30940 [Variovorax paradoxus]|nr:hypothetical protein [Variovorax paradoxus]